MIKNGIWIFIVAFLILVVFLPTFSKKQEIKQKNIQLEKQIEDFKRENVRLREEKRLLIEDPVYLERVAREKMGIVRDGEMVYRLIPQEKEEE